MSHTNPSDIHQMISSPDGKCEQGLEGMSHRRGLEHEPEDDKTEMRC